MAPKQKISEAALTVFARYGYRQATMELVADEARMSRQALYRHFANKEELFAAAIDLLHGRALAAAAEAAARARNMNLTASDILVAQVLTRSEFLFLRLRGTAHGDELIQENLRLCGHIAAMYGERFAGQLAETIRTEGASGRLSLRDEVAVESLARYLIDAARGIKTRVPPVDLEEMRAEFRAMLPLLVRGAEIAGNARKTKAPARRPRAEIDAFAS